MDLSIKTAISRVRKDKSYKIKTFSVGLIVTVILILNILQGNCQDNRLYLASFTVFAIIQIISAFLGGYFAPNSNLRLIRGFGKLYEFKNYKKIFKTGFKLLPIAILSIVLMFISFFLSKFMHNYAELSAYNSGISSNLIMGLIFLVIFCLFLFSIYIYCGYLAFCIELKLSIFFKLKIISKILKIFDNFAFESFFNSTYGRNSYLYFNNNFNRYYTYSVYYSILLFYYMRLEY